jgi:methionine-rich copper-binding protein CopC
MIARGAAASLLALIGLVGLAPLASAHSQLVGSSPSDGAVLTTAPAQVTFTFNEEIIPDTATIAITDANGDVVSSTKVAPDGTTVSAVWPAGLQDGMYQVAYRIVSADGHPVTGAIVVTLAAAGDAASLAATASAAPSAVASPAGSADSSGSSISAAAVVAIALLAAAGVVAAVLTRRRRGARMQA